MIIRSIPPMIVNLPSPDWCFWFTGFVDGEGYFQIAKNGLNKFSTFFKLEVRNDDREIIQEIQRKLNCGKINDIDVSYSRKKGGLDCNKVRFAVSKRNDLLMVVIPLFDQYPLMTKKRNAYEIWREAVINPENKKELYFRLRQHYKNVPLTTEQVIQVQSARILEFSDDELVYLDQEVDA